MVYAVSAEGIRGAVTEALPKIKACYEGWVVANPALAGRLRVAFTITAEADAEDIARITEVHIQGSELDHGLLEGCVLNVVDGLSFDPPPDGAVTVTYPFHFSAEGDDR
jgi:hypothetical protein